MFVTKPKIFISSTIADLPSERKAVLQAVEKAGGISIMSEFTMEAVSKDSVTACIDNVRSSDIYVLVLGGRYGWQPDGKESITELEYKAAFEKKLPIIVFNTTYTKEALQKEFEGKVEANFFRKTVSDAFELETEMLKSLKSEIETKQNEYFNKTEFVYSNLVEIKIPQYIFKAELNINKKEIKAELKSRGEKLKFKASLFDYAVTALRLKGAKFPGDWIIWEKSILSFHDLQDSRLPLTQIIDLGTAERLSCDEFYSISQDTMSVFKHLLKNCLSTKLHKQGIKWIKDSKLFAFMPIQKDDLDRWKPREIEWTKTKKVATRTVVDIKYNLKNQNEVFNMRCLAFRTNFHFINDKWYLTIKPDWVFLWPSLKVCDYAYKNLIWLKKNERNLHVFNHFNFILRYIQPPASESLFTEYKDYEFLKIQDIEKFDFAPIVPDDTWINLESPNSKKKLGDSSGNVDLFGQ